MDLYLSSLMLGVAGLGVMALSGLGNRGHGHGGRGGHSGAAGARLQGGARAGAHAHLAVGARSGKAGAMQTAPGARAAGASQHGVAGKAFWAITSPRFLFSFLLGAGTTGISARPFFGGLVLLAAAVSGGILFERYVVSPLWNVSMRFASEPAATLESAVSDEATAVTSFDVNGQGIVSIEVDGQIVQILATLQRDDRLLGGARVRAGQRVRIDEVDSEKNCCTVSLI